jgi:hypothetical protein
MQLLLLLALQGFLAVTTGLGWVPCECIQHHDVERNG